MDNAEQRMDQIIGRLLQAGVILAAVFVLAGGAVFLVRHATPVTNYQVFSGEPAEFRTISGIFHEAIALHGRGLIQLGLLILIATPIARVIFSVFAFLYQRDWTYVFVTLIVLAILTYSLFGHHG
jgi:uncharacterized membrane protein